MHESQVTFFCTICICRSRDFGKIEKSAASGEIPGNQRVSYFFNYRGVRLCSLILTVLIACEFGERWDREKVVVYIIIKRQAALPDADNASAVAFVFIH